METKLSAHQKLIAKEIKWLNREIASCRYDLTEAIIKGVPLELCGNINTALGEYILKRHCLRVGAYVAYADRIRYTLLY